MDGDRDRDPHWSSGLSSQGPNEEQKEGENEQGSQERERYVHPPWELTKASWNGTDGAYDQTGLSECG